MINDFKEVITNVDELNRGYTFRGQFIFTSITYPYNVYDAIVIKNPINAQCSSPVIDDSSKSLEEHIEFINANLIEKALIIANNIDFIVKCKSLKYINVIPADDCGNNFDYSPLYKMTQLKGLQCRTIYGNRWELSTNIDYSQIVGIESIRVDSRGDKNYEQIDTLKSLIIVDSKCTDLMGIVKSKMLDTLVMNQCKITSLDGIGYFDNMQCLYLYNNRRLCDISALIEIKSTLKALRIDGCSKITDFSVLKELTNLQLLELSGNNVLNDLDFIKEMRNLKTFVFSMNVLNGDLSACMNLSYVYSEKNRKHYNIHNSKFPRRLYIRGNESIEEWRRLE